MDSRAKALVPRDSNPTENAYIRGAKGDDNKFIALNAAQTNDNQPNTKQNDFKQSAVTLAKSKIYISMCTVPDLPCSHCSHCHSRDRASSGF